MEQLSGEAVSTLFAAQEKEDESVCDLTMDFSLDCSQDRDYLTSTPTKLDDTCNLFSDTSSPVSFLGPNYSHLSAEEDSVDLHKSMTEVDDAPCSPDQPQANMNNSNQAPQIVTQPEDDADSSSHVINISTDTSQPAANAGQISTDSGTTSTLPHARGVKIVGDNIDKTVKTRYMRVDQQGRSLHYFHAYATRDRFDLSMPEVAPSVPDNPDLDKLLPSDFDKSTMKQFFAIHVARILCKHMPFFTEDFGDVIPEHIEHPMSSEMSKKSEVVSLLRYVIAMCFVCMFDLYVCFL